METATLPQTAPDPVLDPRILVLDDEDDDWDDDFDEDEEDEEDGDWDDEDDDWDDEDDDWDDEDWEEEGEEEAGDPDEDDDDWDDEPNLETRFRGLIADPDAPRPRLPRPPRTETRDRKSDGSRHRDRSADRTSIGDDDDDGLD